MLKLNNVQTSEIKLDTTHYKSLLEDEETTPYVLIFLFF